MGEGEDMLDWVAGEFPGVFDEDGALISYLCISRALRFVEGLWARFQALILEVRRVSYLSFSVLNSINTASLQDTPST